MLIKVSEKPILSIDDGKMFGTLKGLILYENRLSFLYCRAEERYLYIPVEHAILNQDAVLLKKNYADTLLSTSSETAIYTQTGEKIGLLDSVELDDDFYVTAIKTQDTVIQKDSILSMGNIIVVDLKKDKVKPQLSAVTPQEKDQLGYINTELSLPQDAPAEDPSDSEEEEASSNHLTQEEPLEEVPEKPDEEACQEAAATEDAIESINTAFMVDDHISSDIDPRYHYLCGKKLLDGIEIAGTHYAIDTVIDAELIQFALDNNAIVKVIMNAED
ncbi:hypothetical protein SAMN05660297_03318 [Natronincola peptidivorans]|uniref:PRC-barrel domain-containing protein n=1 Tax=Natronincola peptidivorans TaxID=426128 RepID=A0A1I0GQW9_9FIRM|nr:hypothetical protein [Natronincola peptidivorans]SET73510.1 hypothetical protein SAMN05660297_03318 [Natronincola peptidivorans]